MLEYTIIHEGHCYSKFNTSHNPKKLRQNNADHLTKSNKKVSMFQTAIYLLIFIE